MADVKYTDEHEWISIEGDVGTIGISAYAQEQLGDVVFVDVPQAERDAQRAKMEQGQDKIVADAHISPELVKLVMSDVGV